MIVLTWKLVIFWITHLLDVTTLITPGGIPASSASEAKARADRGVSSEGLSTHVQPAARAALTWKQSRWVKTLLE